MVAVPCAFAQQVRPTQATSRAIAPGRTCPRPPIRPAHGCCCDAFCSLPPSPTRVRPLPVCPLLQYSLFAPTRARRQDYPWLPELLQRNLGAIVWVLALGRP